MKVKKKKSKPSLPFGEQVRRRRQARGWSLETLAARAGLTPNYIGGVEISRRNPSISTVLALASGLGVTPGALLGSGTEISSEAAKLGRLFEEATEEIRQGILLLLRAHARNKNSE